MARICELTGKRTRVGMNVSHSNRHTKRTFMPNLQERTIASPLLGRRVTLTLSTRAIRTLDKYNGLDGYLLQVRNARVAEGFSLQATRLRKQVLAAAAAKGLLPVKVKAEKRAPAAAKAVKTAAKPAAKKPAAKAE